MRVGHLLSETGAEQRARIASLIQSGQYDALRTLAESPALPAVDARYTGTPEDAVRAAEDDERDASDRQTGMRRRTAAGGSRSGRKKSKKVKPLVGRCSACGYLATADCGICQRCGGEVLRAKETRGRPQKEPGEGTRYAPVRLQEPLFDAARASGNLSAFVNRAVAQYVASGGR